MAVTISLEGSQASSRQMQEKFPDGKKTNECPITNVLSRISDKWTMHAIIALGKTDRLRFSELKRLVEGISQRMLTVTLRTLEQDGFVTRTVYPEIPPRVEYELTPLGRSLLSEMLSLSDWANNNMQHVLESRRRYESNLSS